VILEIGGTINIELLQVKKKVSRGKQQIMEPSTKINVITEIADRLGNGEWEIIDLTLRQFGMPYTDQWSGGKKEYVVNMIENAGDDQLFALAEHFGVKVTKSNQPLISSASIEALLKDIETQKSLMISVSTGGQRIQEVNEEYKNRREEILTQLRTLDIDDPNNYSDLWAWYGKWSDGSLPSYSSAKYFRRD
jgi:hypothetical protein